MAAEYLPITSKCTDRTPPSVSCVIPAYERVELFGRSLLSAATQEDIALEVIVCDDSKSDGIRAYCAAFHGAFPSIRYLEGARTGNPIDNWNLGLEHASGEFIVILHQDEFFVDRRYLHNALSYLTRTGSRGVVGRCQPISITRKSRFPLVQRVLTAFGAPRWLLFCFNWIGPTAAVVFRSDASLRFDRKLAYLVDIDFYLRLFKPKDRIEFLPGTAVASLAHHQDQITATLDPRVQTHSELTACLQKHSGITLLQQRTLRFIAWLRVR